MYPPDSCAVELALNGAISVALGDAIARRALKKYHIFEGTVALINVLNISFGILLSIKLRRFVKMGEGASNQMKRLRFQALIIKNVILTLTGTVSTTIGYLLVGVTQDSTFVSIDMLVNCCVIGLMFNWNSKCYRSLCRGCICIFRIFIPSSSETVAKTVDYLHSNDSTKKQRCAKPSAPSPSLT